MAVRPSPFFFCFTGGPMSQSFRFFFLRCITIIIVETASAAVDVERGVACDGHHHLPTRQVHYSHPSKGVDTGRPEQTVARHGVTREDNNPIQGN